MTLDEINALINTGDVHRVAAATGYSRNYIWKMLAGTRTMKADAQSAFEVLLKNRINENKAIREAAQRALIPIQNDK